jgi:outer membrane protein assembly factor BamB
MRGRAAIVLFLVGALGAHADDPGQTLRNAAQAGDLAAVRAALDAGAPVDAANAQGVTALAYGAEKGRLDIVRLLVERGATVDTRDRFFGSSPLQVALLYDYYDVARYLVEKGAADVDQALYEAAQGGNLELAHAALATGRVDPLELAAARRTANARPSEEMKALLAAARAERHDRPPYAVNPERLNQYTGRYRQGPGPETTVAVAGPGLELTAPGAAPMALHAVSKDRFENAEGTIAVFFSGRAGLVEGMRVNRDGEVASFGVVAVDPVALPKAETAAAEKAARTAPMNWPSFRGPAASGIGDGQGVVGTWDVAAGRNVRFKTALPGLGNSSPIVWGDRIFVTTAVSTKGETAIRTGLYGEGTSVDDTSEHSYRVLALDKVTGRIVWDREAHRSAPGAKRHLKATQANSTPATDGRRVIALFGSVGQLVAYDFEGRRLWKRDLGVMDCGDPVYGSTEWGHASSPLVHGQNVIVQGDRKRDSFLAAYRLTDGGEVWRVARDELSTWATPNVIAGPKGEELVTNGKKIRAYDPSSGQLLWTLGPNSEVVVATPIAGEGHVLITAGYPPVRPVYAVRPGQRGDLSLPEGRTASEAISWSHARGGTYIPTPIRYGEYVYTCNNNGLLTCYKDATGEQVYQTRIAEGGGSFSASPVAADGRLFFSAETGEVYVLRAGPRFELLARNDMGEVVMATPAISDGLLVVRTTGHVVGLGEATR